MESFGDSTISTIYDRRKSNTFLALNRFAKPNTGDNENCRDRINFNKRSSVSSKPKPIKPTESYPPVFDSDKFAVPRARSESAVIPRPDPPVVMRDRTSTVALRNRSSTCQLSGEAFMERRNSRHRASISSISNLYNNMNISEGGAWASRRSSVASMESGCSNFSLELSEKEWMVRSAVGDCNTLSRLLLQDRNFALFKDFVSGYTGLHWACKLGRPDMAKIMLECGADVNARSSSGQTPLHLAAQCGYLELVALLVEHHKANIRIRDYSGRRPIQYASHEASPQLRFWLTPKDDQLHKYADIPTVTNIRILIDDCSDTDSADNSHKAFTIKRTKRKVKVVSALSSARNPAPLNPLTGNSRPRANTTFGKMRTTFKIGKKKRHIEIGDILVQNRVLLEGQGVEIIDSAAEALEDTQSAGEQVNKEKALMFRKNTIKKVKLPHTAQEMRDFQNHTNAKSADFADETEVFSDPGGMRPRGRSLTDQIRTAHKADPMTTKMNEIRRARTIKRVTKRPALVSRQQSTSDSMTLSLSSPSPTSANEKLLQRSFSLPDDSDCPEENICPEEEICPESPYASAAAFGVKLNPSTLPPKIPSRAPGTTLSVRGQSPQPVRAFVYAKVSTKPTDDKRKESYKVRPNVNYLPDHEDRPIPSIIPDNDKKLDLEALKGKLSVTKEPTADQLIPAIPLRSPYTVQRPTNEMQRAPILSMARHPPPSTQATSPPTTLPPRVYFPPVNPVTGDLLPPKVPTRRSAMRNNKPKAGKSHPRGSIMPGPSDPYHLTVSQSSSSDTQSSSVVSQGTPASSQGVRFR